MYVYIYIYICDYILGKTDEPRDLGVFFGTWGY